MKFVLNLFKMYIIYVFKFVLNLFKILNQNSNLYYAVM